MIKDRGKFDQKIDFTGFKFGTMAPTDIDAFMEFKNKLFIFFEVKGGTSPLREGQRIALENVCKAIQADDKHGFAILCRHDKAAPSDIDFIDCTVDKYFYRGEWRDPKEPCDVFTFTQWLYTHFILGESSS